MILSELLKKTRKYFWSRDFEEVEVSYLNPSLPLEPNLYSFNTKNYYLPTSPEFALKKHLAKNKFDCFAIGHSFRDLESSGPHHTPEFIMLEWYEVNKNLKELKKSTQNFLTQFLPNLRFTELELKNVNFDNEPDFNQYFLNKVEPTLPKDAAVFVSGYPAFLSPLAEVETHEADIFLRDFNAPALTREKKLSASKRFELYINGIEIANACTENRNAESIKSAFLTEQTHRQQNHLPTHPISEEFIANCADLPPCSGIGLGLNRLLMVINGDSKI